MIDFSKYLDDDGAEKSIHPLEIYESLDRASDKGPLRQVQAAILQTWHDHHQEKKDVIVKLHTGQGKTLIGLLILQSRLNATGRPVLYLCPNKLLVDQTCEQAKQFGFKYCRVDRNNQLPQDFLDGTSMLITHVQMLFNGMTRFGLKQRSRMVDCIVLDDSHACIDTIQDVFTLKIPAADPLYQELFTLFELDLEEQGQSRTEEIRQGAFEAFLPVPYWAWTDKQQEVVRFLVAKKDGDMLKFTWPLISDIIADCQCVISGTSIEISPYLNPIEQFGTFAKCEHRIFMSATTNNDAFFIKSLEVDLETIKAPLKYAGEKWSGEKMILIPYLIHEGLDKVSIVNQFAKTDEKRRYGVVALTPSKESAAYWQECGAIVPDTNSIQKDIQDLRDGHFSRTIALANRYDGIDLPDDSCRILTLDSKPFTSLLAERLLEQYRGHSKTIDIKIAQKIEQGLGRAVRGEKDYCVILITGHELETIMRAKNYQAYFSAQTNKQIDIGMNLTKIALDQTDEDDGPTRLWKLIQLSIKRDDQWKKYYVKQMETVKERTPDLALLDMLELEKKAEAYHRDGQHTKAIETIQALLDKHVKPDNKTDRAFYLQEMARYSYRNQRSASNNYQVNAYKTNRELLKPIHGIEFHPLKIDKRRTENIQNWLNAFTDHQDLQLQVNATISDLSFGVSADKFELALHQLGLSLGFACERPDKEVKKGPDNLWNVQADQYILFECKNQVAEDRSEIVKTETGQIHNAHAWFNQNYGSRKIKNVLIIPTKMLSAGAGFTIDVDIMRKKGLNQLKANYRRFFEELKPYELSTITEKQLDEYLRLHHLTVDDIWNSYTEKPIPKK